MKKKKLEESEQSTGEPNGPKKACRSSIRLAQKASKSSDPSFDTQRVPFSPLSDNTRQKKAPKKAHAQKGGAKKKAQKENVADLEPRHNITAPALHGKETAVTQSAQDVAMENPFEHEPPVQGLSTLPDNVNANYTSNFDLSDALLDLVSSTPYPKSTRGNKRNRSRPPSFSSPTTISPSTTQQTRTPNVLPQFEVVTPPRFSSNPFRLRPITTFHNTSEQTNTETQNATGNPNIRHVLFTTSNIANANIRKAPLTTSNGMNGLEQYGSSEEDEDGGHFDGPRSIAYAGTWKSRSEEDFEVTNHNGGEEEEEEEEEEGNNLALSEKDGDEDKDDSEVEDDENEQCEDFPKHQDTFHLDEDEGFGTSDSDELEGNALPARAAIRAQVAKPARGIRPKAAKLEAKRVKNHNVLITAAAAKAAAKAAAAAAAEAEAEEQAEADWRIQSRADEERLAQTEAGINKLLADYEKLKEEARIAKERAMEAKAKAQRDADAKKAQEKVDRQEKLKAARKEKAKALAQANAKAAGMNLDVEDMHESMVEANIAQATDKDTDPRFDGQGNASNDDDETNSMLLALLNELQALLNCNNTPEENELWRSPRRHEKTLVTDFMSGLSSRRRLTPDDLVIIAENLKKKVATSRRDVFKDKLHEINGMLSNPEVAKALGRPLAKAKTGPTQRQRPTGTGKRPAQKQRIQRPEDIPVNRDQQSVPQGADEQEEEDFRDPEDVNVVDKYLDKKGLRNIHGQLWTMGAPDIAIPTATQKQNPRGQAGPGSRQSKGAQKIFAPRLQEKLPDPRGAHHMDEHTDDMFIQDHGGAMGSFGRALKSAKSVRIDAPTKSRGDESRKRSRYIDVDLDEEDDEEDDAGDDEPPPQKTKRRKKRKTDRPQKIHEDSEMIDIGEDEKPVPREGPKPNQLKFYRGEARTLMNLAIFFMRLYLLNVNAYPDAEELLTWTRNAYVAACKSHYGASYKEHVGKYNTNISKLLQRETWGLRGKIKRIVSKLLPKFYRIFPRPNAYDQHPNPRASERAYIAGKVGKLLANGSPFIQAPLEPNGPSVPFAHSAICEFIHTLVFCKKASKRPLAQRDLHAFNPIPLPLIAYVVTALLHGLEEYSNGVLEKRDFSDRNYSDYYKDVLALLRRYEVSKVRGPPLQRVRERIFETGRLLLYGRARQDNGRPTLPGCSDEEIDMDEEEAFAEVSDVDSSS